MSIHCDSRGPARYTPCKSIVQEKWNDIFKTCRRGHSSTPKVLVSINYYFHSSSCLPLDCLACQWVPTLYKRTPHQPYFPGLIYKWPARSRSVDFVQRYDDGRDVEQTAVVSDNNHQYVKWNCCVPKSVFCIFFLNNSLLAANQAADSDSKTCGKILVGLSWFLVVLTMPFSLFVCFKVSNIIVFFKF